MGNFRFRSVFIFAYFFLAVFASDAFAESRMQQGVSRDIRGYDGNKPVTNRTWDYSHGSEGGGRQYNMPRSSPEGQNKPSSSSSSSGWSAQTEREWADWRAKQATEQAKAKASAPSRCCSSNRGWEERLWLVMRSVCQYDFHNSEDGSTWTYQSTLNFQQEIQGSLGRADDDFRLSSDDRNRLWDSRVASQAGTATYAAALKELRDRVRRICENTCNPEIVPVADNLEVSKCKIVSDSPAVELMSNYRYHSEIHKPVVLKYTK